MTPDNRGFRKCFDRTVASSLAVGMALSGCHSDPSVGAEGSWASGRKFDWDFLTLTREGDRVTGFACANSEGVTVYSGVPIEAEGSNIRFVLTANTVGACCAHRVGYTFDGRITSGGQIRGTLTRPSDPPFARILQYAREWSGPTIPSSCASKPSKTP